MMLLNVAIRGLPRAAGVFLGMFMLTQGVMAQSRTPESWFREEGYVSPVSDRIIGCHGYGCEHRTEIAVQPSWFGKVAAVMRQGRSSPEAERKALREAVRIYTAYLARRFGGKPDVPKSPASLSGKIGQMDCLDETANTTSLLLVLKHNGLLVHHQVERPQSRGFFLDGRYPHYTAVIVDSRSRIAWAVDPWARMPGQKPDLLPLEEWQKVS
jgi:hypothetical protein